MSERFYMDLCYDTGCATMDWKSSSLSEIKSLLSNKDYKKIEERYGNSFKLLEEDIYTLSNLGCNLGNSPLNEQSLNFVLNFIKSYSGDKYIVSVDVGDTDWQVGEYCINHDIDRGIIFARESESITHVYTPVGAYDVYYLGTIISSDSFKPKYEYYLREYLLDGVYLIKHPVV